ncbi:UBX domain-containing protein 4-like [Homarus americanus]|uniref:UBX domain-containing protein 4 n=1 Tax=Homarus americanus TaxID=6706 RepID=A0A8J5JTH2_HOMAM|nr:UBX domain-containing protein 4-like [Homarus americanus]
MQWFQGSIPEAIGAAKSRNAIFVVYVHDSSEESKTTDGALTHKNISSSLGSDNFVAIQLENGTEGAKQFSQIYPLVLVPSLFFISGQTGIPLEVLGGPLTVENLQQKLNKLVPGLEQASTSSDFRQEQQADLEKSNENLPNSSSCPTEESEFLGEDKSEATVEVHSVKKTEGDDKSEATVEVDSVKKTEGDDKSEATVEVDSVKKTEGDDKSEATVEADSVKKTEDDPEPQPGTSAEGLEDDMPLTEKVDRAKFLLAQKQAKIKQEKAEEEKLKEVERRKMGQDVSKRKQQQDDDELRAAARERRKDKEEDKLARERVKAQIVADREERDFRAALLRGEHPSSNQGPAPVVNVASASTSAGSHNTISRLKFRLPDGSSSIAQFPAEANLSEVIQHIQQNVNLPFSSFNLGSTVNPRPFTPEDYSTSLRDLGLVPSAIMVILPISSGGGGRVVPSSGGFWDLLWILLSPMTFLFGLVRQFLRGSSEPRTPPPSPDEPEAKRLREEGPSNSQNRPSTAYGRRGDARLRRDGNIHRLGNNDDDDDENNTWNGNSTQQM